MADNLYDNLLRATDNTKDITTEKYGTITKINNDNKANVKEEENDIEHSNVPILSNIPCETGDKVIIGFIDNSIYNPVITGNLTRGILDGIEHPCDLKVLEEDLVLDFCDETGHGEASTTTKPTNEVIESFALNNLGTASGANQSEINQAINTRIGQGGGGSIVVDDTLSTTSTNPVQNKVINEALEDKANYTHSHTTSDIENFPTLSTVATTGSYNDLTDKPNISGKEDATNKVSSWSSTPTDAHYPSEKLVKDSLDEKASTTHHHGNLQYDGQVGETAQANKNVVTDANGKITTENKPTIPTKTSDLTNDGDGTNVFIKNDDSRLSDARQPTTHSHSISDVNNLQTSLNGKSNVGHTHKTVDMTSDYAFSNLETSIGATQHQINSKINELIGQGGGGGGGVSLACVSDFDIDTTDIDDIELFLDACSGKVISSITKSTVGNVDTYTITYNDNTTYSFSVTNGVDGDDGKGIVSIMKTSTSGLVDTYTITYSDNTTSTFTVTNGSNATVTVDSALSGTSTNPVQNKVINTALNGKASSTHTHTKSEITDFPTIPSKTSDLTNDSNFISTSNTSGLMKNDGTIDTTQYSTFTGNYGDLTNKPSYTPTITPSTTGAYKIGSINISGSDVDIYGKDTGGGGEGSVIGTGSFSINQNGHLVVELPNAVDNPYFIDSNGHLYYDTHNTHNGD